MTNSPNRTALRNAVVTALERLRAEFPLEARLVAADAATRRAYARVLRHWLQGIPPPPTLLDANTRAALAALDAVVPDESGIGCYPFSANTTGITVTRSNGTAFAMCAIDALAVARLAGEVTTIHARCDSCQAKLAIVMGNDGSLDHDQVGRARVIWKSHAGAPGTCSSDLCRHILFICTDCPTPAGSDCYTLPQAATIGNAFFAFQRTLLTTAK